jgi:hypothetical protein
MDARRATGWLPGDQWEEANRVREGDEHPVSSEMGTEVSRGARGLRPILERHRGFEGFQVLTDPDAGEGRDSCVGQVSMMSSYLYEPLVPKTYEVSVRT